MKKKKPKPTRFKRRKLLWKRDTFWQDVFISKPGKGSVGGNFIIEGSPMGYILRKAPSTYIGEFFFIKSAKKVAEIIFNHG